MFTKCIAFIQKDYKIQISYKVGFILTIFGAVFPIFSYYFISYLLNDTNQESLVKYGDDYFAFTLVGVSFTTYFITAVNTFSNSIRRAQMAGCLEALLSSQTSAKSIVFMSSLYSFIFSLLTIIVMFLVSWLFLGYSFENINIASTIVSFSVSLLVFISIGIFAASLTIVFKQGNPVQALYGAVSSFLGGALFPVSIFPGWLKVISFIFPITHTLEVMRLSMLQGYSIGQLSMTLLFLLILGIILFPLSLMCFQIAVDKGKRDGTLMQY